MKKYFNKAIILLACGVLTTAYIAKAQVISADPIRNTHVESFLSLVSNDKDLEQVANKFYTALLEGDHAKTMGIYDQEFFSQHALDFTSRMIELEKDARSKESTGISIDGTKSILFEGKPAYLAVVNISVEKRIGKNAEPFFGRSSLLHVWHKVNGEWKVVFLFDFLIDIQIPQKPDIK